MDKDFFGFMYFVKQLGFVDSNSENIYASTLWRNKSKYDTNGWEIIKDEFNIKFKKEYVRRNNNSRIISATDLANYTFCPVRFVISKSFDIVPTEKMNTGISFHKRNTLLKRCNLAKGQKVDISRFRRNNDLTSYQDFWEDVSTSIVVYLGHSEEGEKQYFYDSKGIFISQPDYIFSNKIGKNFVVEEKFILDQNGKRYGYNNSMFYSNHKVQLSSYIHGISDINISYGYLVYWIYEPNYQIGYKSLYVDKNDPFIIRTAHVLKINKSDNWKLQLNETFTNIKRLKETGKESFDTDKININKCINCSVSMFCSHKTGRFKELNMTYPDTYLELQKSTIPKQRLIPSIGDSI